MYLVRIDKKKSYIPISLEVVVTGNCFSWKIKYFCKNDYRVILKKITGNCVNLHYPFTVSIET